MNTSSRLDDAARAGWLYYVAGNTQDEIARKLGVSRQSAQRLVSLAVSEKLVKVHLDHPIANCMELMARLQDRFGLVVCEVVPSDPGSPLLLNGIAIAGAMEMQRHLKSRNPKVLALGTGRTLRAAVEQIPVMDCPHHKIVSLLGNMMQDGSATPYNVVIRLAERVGARHFPMPLPVYASSAEELASLNAQTPVRHILQLCHESNVRMVGLGSMDMTAPLHVDGFIDRPEMERLQACGAVGEITSRVFDREGRILDSARNALSTSAPLEHTADRPVIGLAAGPGKVAAIAGALRGALINGLITDEATARSVLNAI
ncbi:DNA-binding transcriptional regulator LsrR (DeoR family) [Palleronia aestuarii]|uniref:DNA-binding transcriptional regulator LsrR (DeoR family) n=1 Tax=Palleronia aestuarii TaxID=568105 RepID=A0A2W7NH76_9RHOB|nr:sugar-binding transcriptional regulator [Palleronia aestuarii]PZX19598.1 DNA-binding transcriptional regulator LsrR (DeoR family) [Palleronia aestuarii]